MLSYNFYHYHFQIYDVNGLMYARVASVCRKPINCVFYVRLLSMPNAPSIAHRFDLEIFKDKSHTNLMMAPCKSYVYWNSISKRLILIR